MQKAKRIAINTGFLYARMGLTIVISLYSTRLILAALGIKDFGLFNLVGGAIAMLGFLNASMAQSTQRFISFAHGSGDNQKVKKIFNVSVLLHLIIGGLVLVLLEIIGYYFFNGILDISPDRIEAAKLVYQFMVISTLFTVISVPYDAAINAREDMFLFAILGILESGGKLLIALYITHSTADKLISYGLLIAILSVLLLSIRGIYCKQKYTECTISLKKYYDRKLLKEMTDFAGWSLLASSTSMIAFYSQGIVMNMFFGTIVNAAQGIAAQISGQLGTFALTMSKAINPLIAKSEGAGDRLMMIKATFIGSKITFFLLMLLCVPILIELPYILNLWLKDIPTFTIIFCQLLLFRNLIEQMFSMLISSITAVGNIKKFRIYESLIWLIPLIAPYFLFKNGLPPYYIYIVYITYSVLAAINLLYFSKKTFGLPVRRFLGEVVIPCIISYILVYLTVIIPRIILTEGYVRLLSVFLVNIIAFIFIVWHIGLKSNERAIINNYKKILISRLTNLIKNKSYRGLAN